MNIYALFELAEEKELTWEKLETLLKKSFPKELFSTGIDSFTFCNFISIRLPLKLNKCQVRKSLVHNNGVFATQNIKKLELITLYPADIVKIYPDGRGTTKGLVKYGYYNRTSMPKEYHIIDREDARLQLLHHYDFELNPKVSIIGHPKIIDNPAYLGHMINDSCNNGKDEAEYNKSLQNSNVVAKPIYDYKYIVIIASRNIQAGEELFLSYGFKYWRDL